MKKRSLKSMENDCIGKPYKRPLAYSERLYLAANRVMSPFCNRMVLEGVGDVDIVRWRLAVEKASEANPDSRLVLKGILGGCFWEDSGKTPPIIEVDGNGWTGYNGDDMPHQINQPFVPAQGPNCDIIIVYGNPIRIVFRSLHAVMDGQGTMLWIKNIFRALRGETLINTNSSITDYELIDTLHQKETRKNFPKNCVSFTGEKKGKKGEKTDVIWCRKTIAGSHRGLVSKAAVLIAKEVWASDGFHARFMIPVDLRVHKKELQSTANLSNPLYVELSPDTVSKQVYNDIKGQLQTCREGIAGRFDHLICYTPLWLVAAGIKAVLFTQKISRRYGMSGIISSMGTVDLNDFIGGGFDSSTVYAIPPHPSTIPFFLGIFNTSEHIELTGCITRNLCSERQLVSLMEKIVKGLQSVD